MNKKCLGCGVELQEVNKNEIGYVNSLDLDLCERCFRVRNYGDYTVVSKDNDKFLSIVKDINQTRDLVLFVIDVFNINNEVIRLAQEFSNPTLVVLTKRDLFAKDIYNKKFTDKITNITNNIVDYSLISSKNNDGFDDLKEKIYKYKKSKNVYVIGLTNAGKSTMLNKFVNLYTDKEHLVTTSMLPSTTLDTVKVNIADDLILVDTPGIIDHSIFNYIDTVALKKITPNKLIRPITYQVKVDQSFIIEDLLRVEVKANNNITMFFSNKLNINRFYKDHDRLLNLEKYVLDVKDNQDIVISGLGFIKVVKKSKIIIYTIPNVEVSVRDALI